MTVSSYERSALGPTGDAGGPLEPKLEAEIQNEAPRADRKPVYEPIDVSKAAAEYAPPQSTAAQPAPHNPGQATVHDPAVLAKKFRGKGHR